MKPARRLDAGGRAAVPARRRPRYTNKKLLLDVLQLIAAGHSNRLIARQLSISLETAKDRVQALLVDLGAVDRANAVSIAYQRGILQVGPR